MQTSYPGPLRHEPLAVELHNTLYAVAREPFDGLETVDGMKAWLAGIRDRLPAAARDADPSRRSAFLVLRAAVRDALHAVIEGAPVPSDALEMLMPRPPPLLPRFALLATSGADPAPSSTTTAPMPPRSHLPPWL